MQQDLKTQTLLQLQQHCSPNPFTGPFIGPPSLDTVQKLQLAATAFRCLRCNAGHAHNIHGDWDKAEPLLYPKLLNHTCFTRQLYPLNNSDDSVYLKNSYFRSREGWNNSLLRVDTNGVDMMEAIIKFCNLDPASATLNDLDDLDVWLGCRDWADWYEGPDVAEVSVFGWRNAVRYLASILTAYNDLLMEPKHSSSIKLNDTLLSLLVGWSSRETRKHRQIKMRL